MYLFSFILKRKTSENFVLIPILEIVLRIFTVHSVSTHDTLDLNMETRSRTTKLIVKNVEMLESSKFDKFDKVSQWLDKLDTFEFQQQQTNPHITTAANQQNTSSRMSQDKNDDFFDSDSSVNTGMAPMKQVLFFSLILVTFSFFSFFFFFSFHPPARYILTNRKNKRKSSTQCRSKIKKFRDNDVQFEYDLDELESPGHKLKRLKIDSNTNVKYCTTPVQKMNANEINFNGT